MYVDIGVQAAVFGQGLALGALLGLVYDGMRTLRRSIRLPALAFVLDVVFWLGTVAALFALALSPAPRYRAMHALIPMPKPMAMALIRFCTG